MLTLNREFVKAFADCINVNRCDAVDKEKSLPMKNIMFPCRRYHFHGDRVISSNVNDCHVVDKEEAFVKVLFQGRVEKTGNLWYNFFRTDYYLILLQILSSSLKVLWLCTYIGGYYAILYSFRLTFEGRSGSI